MKAIPAFQRTFATVICVCLFVNFSLAQYPAGSPVAINGKLKVTGTNLVNECGNPVQLRGMSTHGVQWFPNCYTTGSLNALVNDWGIDVYRIAMYVQEGGYVNNPSYWKTYIDNMVTECANRGIYCMIDWHILNPGDPNANINEARDFWTYMSSKHAGKKHVLYEICNEPNGISWATVKNYANDIIPRIRANDPSTIIIVGTPTWSQDVDIAAQDKLNYTNLMYALHFYSGTHTGYLRDKANAAIANGVALFVTECGTSTASGDGGPYLQEMQTWIDWMAANKVSWINWNYADKSETSSALNAGACNAGQWTNTSTSGTFIRQKILSPADNFVCNGSGGGGGGGVAIPGTVEAENWTAQSGVLAETTRDVGGGQNVGFIEAGDWMEYSVNAAAAGSLYAGFRVASPVGGRLQLLRGATVLATVDIPATGDYQSWTTVAVPVAINAGTQTVRVNALTAGFNINWISFGSTVANNSFPVPGTIQAESWSNMSGVLTENTSDAGGGFNVGFIDNGDWMDYYVNVATAGNYTINYRVASLPGGGQIQLRNGGNILATTNIPATGGYQNWITQTANITLAAGYQTLRLHATTGGFNVNWFSLATISQPSTGTVKVQYRTSDGSASTNTLRPLFQILNTGSSAIPLPELKLRYWYSKEGSASQNYYCDWAAMGCGNIITSFGNNFMEIGFAGGTLPANGNTGEIQSRIAKADWTNYTQTGDYSFDPSKTSFTDWNKVTLYRNGALVWGIEPGGATTNSNGEPKLASAAKEDDSPDLMRVGPNPAKSQFTLMYRSAINQKATIMISDSKSVLQKTKQTDLKAGINNIEMSISALTDGLYFVTITPGNGKPLVKRLFVVNN